MGLLTETVKIKVNNRTYKYYESLGYKIPKKYNEKKKKYVLSLNESFEIKVHDLQRGSGVIVTCQCDNCEKVYQMQYCCYLKHDMSNGFLCKSCTRKILISGENHPNWNPMLTEEDRSSGRNYPAYKEFIKKVLIRDNYTCFYCGNKDHNNVAVHHLDGYDWCVSGRVDEANAVCLCRQCHSNFHAHYGMGGNTKEQFKEWAMKDVSHLNRYDGKISSAREVVCLDDKNIFKSCLDAGRFYHVDEHQINYCCNKKRGYLSVHGLHFLWLDEYEKMTESKIQEYMISLKPKFWKKVVCVTTNMMFENAADAARYYGMRKGNDKILSNCKGERLSAGKDPITGQKLVWRYYDAQLDDDSIGN